MTLIYAMGIFVTASIFIDDKEREKEKRKLVKNEAVWFDIIYNTNCFDQTNVHNANN